MDGVRSTVFNLVFFAFSFLVAMGLWLLAKVSTRAAMQRLAGRWGRGVRWLVRVMLGSEIEVRGLENVPADRPVLFVGKHQSELDIVMMAALFPTTSAVAMAELEKYPFFGALLRGLDVVLVAVDAGPQGRTRQVVEGTARILAEGRPMLIYPEGELMDLGARERYRKGAGHIYAELEVWAVPIAVSLGTIWPRRRWRKNCGRRGAIAFLEPIPPGMGLEPFMTEIEERIEAATMDLIREHATPEELADAERRYEGRLNNAGRPAVPAA